MLLTSFLCGMVLAILAGCTNTNQKMKMSWTTPPDTYEGVVPPYQRMEELEKLEKSGKGASAQVQQEVSSRLAAEYQKEKEDPVLRCRIIKTLGAYPTESSALVLRHAVSDPDANVRIVACEAWGRRADQEAVQRLGVCVKSDKSSHVRLAALRALGQTGRAEAAQSIAPALEDPSPALQRRAVLALKEVSNQDFGNDVVRWQQWANNKPVDPPRQMSIAERVKNFF